MPKNQLFKSIPPRTVCIEVLNAFGLSGFDDTHNFSRSDLEAVDCVNKMSMDLDHLGVLDALICRF